MYRFDLFIYRGKLVSEQAGQRNGVEAERWRRSPRGGDTTVLAGGTSAEELIEAATIGVDAAVQSGLARLIALAIGIDMSEGPQHRRDGARRGRPGAAAGGTGPPLDGLIGGALVASAIVGCLLLRGMPCAILAVLLGIGAGGMLDRTLIDLVPKGRGTTSNRPRR